MLQNLIYSDIESYFKNRYPLLMIDVVEEVEPGKYAKGYKNFSNNEWFFPAHFADNPNVPGTILLESMLDMMCMAILTLPECKGKETADIRINNLLFRNKVVPGQRIDIVANILKWRRGIASGNCECRIGGGKIVCSADIEIAVPDLMIKMN